jgi:MFS family permease
MLLSVFAVRETKSFADAEAKARTLVAKDPNALTPIAIFLKTSFGDRNLASISQAGLVNNLNDGMAWGLFPLLFASSNQSLPQVATLTAIYPATWGLSQLATGPLSDRLGRKSLLVSGMWLQALAILVVGFSKTFQGFAGGSALLGLGTALVYPTLLAAIGDVAAPAWRASAVGVYRLWRDLGYAIGAVVAGVVADRFGLHGTWVAIAAITFASGVVVAVRMRLPAGPR